MTTNDEIQVGDTLLCVAGSVGLAIRAREIWKVQEISRQDGESKLILSRNGYERIVWSRRIPRRSGEFNVNRGNPLIKARFAFQPRKRNFHAEAVMILT